MTSWMTNRWYVAAWDSGDTIRYRYHGLLIGSDGVAEEMTVRTERLNRPICVETYAIAERQRSVAADPGVKLRAYAIDGGGVRARRVIDRAVAASAVPVDTVTPVAQGQHEGHVPA